MYQLDFSCNGRYIGEPKKKVLTRCIEYQQDSMKGNWESSGATEHTKECHGQFNWIHPRTIALMSNMNSWKPLNCNFDVRFYVSLKTAFSKLSRNITTC